MAKRYYWIKLKTDFFNSTEIDFLMSQENGSQYVVLYQMLCLNTANNNGEMASRIGEMIVPYDVNKIVRDTKYFTFDTVTIALGLFKRLGLVYEENDKVLRIANYDSMVGSETSKAEIMRKKRAADKLESGNNVTKMLPNSSNNVTEEIDIDIRDKSIDIDNKKKENKESSYDLIIDEMVNDNDLKENIYEFIKMRKLIKKPMTDRALKQLINRLYTLSATKEDQLQILDNAIINNWANVYPLKSDKTNASNSYKRVEKVPDWLNKDIEADEASPEEEAEFKKMLENDDFETRKVALQERLKNKYGKGKN